MSTNPSSCCVTTTTTTTTTGYASPLDAFHNGPREKLLYVTAIATNPSVDPDAILTIDVDPQSENFSKIIHELKMPYLGDELHHFGWNSCSSCYGCVDENGLDSDKRRFLFVPGVKSNRFYIIDTLNPKEPKIHQVIEPEQVSKVTNLAFPHTAHCLSDGNVMVSMMGDTEHNAKGGFVLINKSSSSTQNNSKDVKFEITSQWSEKEEAQMKYGYDFWYQPRHNIMVSSEWGAPCAFLKGFDPSLVPTHYGRHIYFWNWKERTLMKRVDLGDDGLIPLEVRFLHDPSSAHGYVACALSSTVFHFYKSTNDEDQEWKIEKFIDIPSVKVKGWALDEMPSLISDFIISLDDKFLYMSNWLHGDIRQYDISDPFVPKLVGQVFVGGSLRKDNGVVTIISENIETTTTECSSDDDKVPNKLVQVPKIKGTTVQGSAQMIQLSLDGKRLYVTNSLFSVWDRQFYPELVKNGSQCLLVDVDTEKGGLKINENFLVDFTTNEGTKYLAHEVRYPGGDCTSDIWV